MSSRVQVIARRAADFGRATRAEGPRFFKNPAPELHPLAEQTEYVRAVRAAKMRHMFAKPFVGSLEGHAESVYSLCRRHRDLRRIVSGGADGEVRVWDAASRACVEVIRAHPQIVNDVSCSPTSDLILSVGADGRVCGFGAAARFSYASDGALAAVDHCWADETFATAGADLELWTPHRNSPIQRFEFGVREFGDSVFNQGEPSLVLAASGGRELLVADVRTRAVARSITLAMRSNAVDWNPQIPFYFVAANDDSALYLFDMRKTEAAVRVFTDHLDPVTCVAFSPNGREFVSGAYDGTIRVWDWENIRSRDCYHTARMQRVFCVCVSPDSKFAFCGSEDMNIRIFKTKADEEMRVVNRKQKQAMQYQERLLQKWRHAPDVHRIADKQNLPKKLFNKRRQRAIVMAAEQRKAIARMANAANPEESKPEPLRKKRVVQDET
jgi:WD repeat and SOF domain-containing protein 1